MSEHDQPDVRPDLPQDQPAGEPAPASGRNFKWSEERRAKWSETAKRNWQDPEYRARCTTPEVTARRLAGAQRYWRNASPEAKRARGEQIRRSKLGKPNPNAVEAMRLARLGKKRPPDVVAKIHAKRRLNIIARFAQELAQARSHEEAWLLFYGHMKQARQPDSAWRYAYLAAYLPLLNSHVPKRGPKFKTSKRIT